MLLTLLPDRYAEISSCLTVSTQRLIHMRSRERNTGRYDRELFTAVKPAQEQADYGTETDGAKDERARNWNREPGDDHEADGDDSSSFGAGDGYVAEAESLRLQPVAAS
jgi:hypothetical protein